MFKISKALFIIIGCLPVLLCIGCGEKIVAGKTDIFQVMQDAEDGWNSGNIESYMNCYQRSDKLRFAGDDRISFGWHSVFENYKAAYPDKTAMGRLEFYDLDVQLLSENTALVVGRWKLDREADQPHGVFTLIMREGAEGWRIIHDHTGSSDGTLDAAEASITAADLLDHVASFTSEKMAGRLPGTSGYRLAAETVADHFAALGLHPGGDDGYFQELSIEANEIQGQPVLQLVGSDHAYTLGEDYVFRGFTGQGSIKAPVVFCGYGLSLPERGYDDYAGVDVKNKIVLVFKQSPAWKLPDGEGWENMSYPRPKAITAAKHGAKAVIMVSRPNDKNPQPLIGSVLHGGGLYPYNIPQLHVSLSVAEELLQASGLDLSLLQTQIDDSQTPASTVLESVIALEVKTKYEKDSVTWNVVGILPGSDPVLSQEYLVLGAHLDHVGMQAGKALFPGANDNASGSAAIMEIAEAFTRAGKAPERTVLFVLFSGEEQGLIGSAYYAENPVRPLENTVAMFNFDCVAHGDSIRIGSGKSSPVLWDKINQLDEERDNLMINGTWSHGGADATPFHKKGLPTLYFVTTNSYDHLHRTSDTVETLNGPLYESLTRLGYRMAAWVAEGKYQKEELVP
jgi:aminopeptidase YwaD